MDEQSGKITACAQNGERGAPEQRIGIQVVAERWVTVEEGIERGADLRGPSGAIDVEIELVVPSSGVCGSTHECFSVRSDRRSLAEPGDAGRYDRPMTLLRIGLAQRNVVVGDLAGNVDRIVATLAEADAAGCHLTVFSELTITGYPPEDLLLKPGFVTDNLAALQQVVAATAGRSCAAVVGFVDGEPGGVLHNAAALCAGGELVGSYHKRCLPNYAVFDEERYFEPGAEPLQLFHVGGVRVGISICEDGWVPGGPMWELGQGGAELVVNINASPYHRGKVGLRVGVVADRAAEAGCPVVYVNQVGGQDELVFDGASMIVSTAGEVVARARQFVDELVVVDLEVFGREALEDRSLPLVALPTPPAPGAPNGVSPPLASPTPVAVPWLDPVAEVYEALVLGTHDYVTKNGFREVVIGLSGGIDSSLVACVAADALGAVNVHGVLMPSQYSSDHSISDAEALADALNLDRRVIAIEPAYAALETLLTPSFEGRVPDLTEENLQSRIRGVLLMALSNKFGWMVLTTSNKSESAVGYSTLYGDSAGGFAVIKDVPKLLVYELCRWRNSVSEHNPGGAEVIPANVLEKPPSAELRPDQRDDQSLPPYEVLDPIIEAYVEGDGTIAGLIASGFDEATVRRIVRLIDLSEYKRRQFPPGPRITAKAFGKDRRLPITNAYRG